MILLAASVAWVSVASGADVRQMLEPARATLAEARATARTMESRFGAGAPPAELRLEYAQLLFSTGRPDEAAVVLEATEGLDGKVLRARALLAAHDYRRAAPLIAGLERSSAAGAGVQRLLFEWWTITSDFAHMEQAVLADQAGAPATPGVEAQFRAAELQLKTLDYAGAQAAWSGIVEHGDLDPEQRTRALRFLGASLYALRRYDEALESYTQALALSPLDAWVAAGIGDTLLKLGRIDDGIEALHYTLELAPKSLRAHQLLGAGYTRLNYTQLFAAFPQSFADARGQRSLDEAEAAREAGRTDEARALYAAIAKAHPEWADVESRRGSLEYGARDFVASRDHFWNAWRLRPEYGRAHDGYSRAIEALQLEQKVYFAADEAALDAAPMPEIAGIGQFVVNWPSLHPRHQKRLALSIEPWARYLPALLEAGATFYVKPLYQRLSEVPEQGQMRDQRIDYDSRLWDDVRGIGGFHSVVGIEDVESRIVSGYDTALHELSHQVHAILAPEWRLKINALFAGTTRRDAASPGAFLSAYAASSQWEYFAEGANSLHTPRRDRFDNREIVHERLRERDPALLALAQHIMHVADVTPSFAMGLIASGEEKIRNGDAQGALPIFDRALSRDPKNETALADRAYALMVLGDLERAQEAAQSAFDAHPENGGIVTQLAHVRWLRGEPVESVVAALESARAGVRADERQFVDMQIGQLSLFRADSEAARRAFGQALEVQPRDAQTLAGLAEADGLDGKWTDAWARYDTAVQVRAGDIDLRVRYARDLIRGQEHGRAGQQVSAALLLDADHPDALALRAWLLLLAGDVAQAREVVTRAHRNGPWSTLATLVLSAAERQSGNEASAKRALEPLERRVQQRTPPSYQFMPKTGRYELIGTFGAIDRIVADALAALAPAPQAAAGF